MELSDLPVFDPREVIEHERDDLLALLDGLADDEWGAPTDAGHWRVKDVALHLLDDDLGWLSRGRDGDTSGLLPAEGDYRDFVRSLDANNERWVVGATGLSRRVVVDLLRWSTGEVNDYYASAAHVASGVAQSHVEATRPKWTMIDLDRVRDLGAQEDGRAVIVTLRATARRRRRWSTRGYSIIR